jgi:ribose transport system substrate-binding protein
VEEDLMVSRACMKSAGGAAAVLAVSAFLVACGGESGGGSSSAKTTAAATASGAPAWCGTKPIVFGMADGGGLNAWSKASAASVMEVVKQCPNVKRVLTSNAGFDLQKAITGLQGMVAQGANAVVIIPDAGGPGSELPGIRSAFKRGVAIVPWGANPGGTPGSDYITYVDADHRQAGEVWAKWMVQHLPDGGDVAFFSGPAGNAPGQQEIAGIWSVLKDHPKIQLVTGSKSWAVSNWDPAVGQRAMAALLAKHPNIRGVFSDEGTTTTGIIRALQAAGRSLPLIASLEANALACDWQRLSKTDKDFHLATVSAQNVAGRVAAQTAIAKAAGVSLSGGDALSPKPILPNPLLEDSIAGPKPVCKPAEPASALLSNNMSDDQLKVLTRTGKFPEGVPQ